MHIFMCSLAYVHTLLIAETPQTPAEGPPFLTHHEGQVLFTTLSLSLHSHSCSLPVISLDCFVPHFPQNEEHLQVSNVASHISGPS